MEDTNFEIGDEVIVNKSGMKAEVKDFTKDGKIIVTLDASGRDITLGEEDIDAWSDLHHGDGQDDEDGDEDGEQTEFYVAVYDEHEERAWIGFVTKRGGTKWHEKPFKGQPDYRWGSSYMSYLEPEQVMQWIRKDYSRGYDVAGPFETAEAAQEFVNDHFGGEVGMNESGWLKQGIGSKRASRLDETRGSFTEGETGWLKEALELSDKALGYEILLQNGKIERFTASSKEAAIAKAKAKKAKSLIRLSKNFTRVGKPIPLDEALSMGAALKRELSKPESGSKLDLKIKKHNADIKAGGEGLFDTPPDGFKFKKDGTIVLEAVGNYFFGTDSEDRFKSAAEAKFGKVTSRKSASIKGRTEYLNADDKQIGHSEIDGEGDKTFNLYSKPLIREGASDPYKDIDANSWHLVRGDTPIAINFPTEERAKSFHSGHGYGKETKVLLGSQVRRNAYLKHNPSVINWPEYSKVKEGVADTIKRGLKFAKRGMIGWDKSSIGPNGEKLGDPKALVKRNKEMDDEALVKMHAVIHKDVDNRGPFMQQTKHSPGDLQKRVIDREMKKRGLKTEEADRCPKCNSLYKNHYAQDAKFAEAFDFEKDALRRHPANSSYMTPEYMTAHYEKRLKDIEASPFKRTKEVARIKAKLEKLKGQRSYTLSGGKEIPIKEAKQFTDFEDWKQAVLLSYPAQAKKIKFKGRLEGKKHTVSAEIPGEDRSYGVWDMNAENGVVLSEGTSPFKPNAKVKIVGGPADVRGQIGFIGEIKTDVSGNRTFVVDISDGSAKAKKSVSLKASDIRLFRESVEIESGWLKQGISSETLSEGKDEKIKRLKADYDNAMLWVKDTKGVPSHEIAKWERLAQKLSDHAKKQYKLDLKTMKPISEASPGGGSAVAKKQA